jgi:WD40 repeat protein
MVRIWDEATGESRELEGHKGVVLSLAFSPDGRLLASGADHALRFWDTATGDGWDIVMNIAAARIVFTADSKTVVVHSFEAGGIDLCDVRTGALKALRGHSAYVTDLALSPASGVAVTAGWDKTARLWDLETGESRVLQGHTDEVLGVAFSPDGNTVASVGKDGAVRVWLDDLPFDPQALRAWIAEAAPDAIEMAAP